MNKKLFKSILLIITFAVVLVAIILNFKNIAVGAELLWKILLPIIIGFGLAFALDRPFSFFKRIYLKLDAIVFKKSGKVHEKLCRAFAIMTVYIIFLAVLSLIIGLIFPQLVASVTRLYKNTDTYIENITVFFTGIEERFGLDISIMAELEDALVGFVSEIPTYLSKILPGFFKVAGSIASSVTNWIMGFAMSIYMLASKEMLLKQCHDILYAFVPEKFAKNVTRISALSSKTFGDFISGQLLDAFVVGVLCFIGMSIFKFEYALLISSLVAVTNVIPIFGPFIGAIPSAFLLFIVNPIQAFWFVVFILVLQQIDGNFICPRIVGDSVGLPAWWVIFAILVGGGTLGVFGMIIGVPTFCIIYRLMAEATAKREAANALAEKNADK